MEVLRVSARKFEKVPGIVNDEHGQGYMDGIVNTDNRMIMALNLENVLESKEWTQLNKMLESNEKKPPSKLKNKTNNPLAPILKRAGNTMNNGWRLSAKSTPDWKGSLLSYFMPIPHRTNSIG
jgi:hypothetical protein